MRESEVACLSMLMDTSFYDLFIIEVLVFTRHNNCDCIGSPTELHSPNLSLIQLPGQETKTIIARKAAGNKSGSLKKQES